MITLILFFGALLGLIAAVVLLIAIVAADLVAGALALLVAAVIVGWAGRRMWRWFSRFSDEYGRYRAQNSLPRAQLRLGDHGGEEPIGDLVVQEMLAVLRERRGVRRRRVDGRVQQRHQQQGIVSRSQNALSLRIEYRAMSTIAFNLCSGGTLGCPLVPYMASNSLSSSASTAFTTAWFRRIG